MNCFHYYCIILKSPGNTNAPWSDFRSNEDILNEEQSLLMAQALARDEEQAYKARKLFIEERDRIVAESMQLEFEQGKPLFFHILIVT